MTPAQRNKYWWEWGKVRQYLLARGVSADAAAQERHRLHIRALGKAKSSTALTNADFDAVIAAFRAVWDDANFSAQMRQQEQAGERAAATRARIVAVAPRIGITAGREMGYLDGMSRRIFGQEHFDDLDDVQLYSLEGILRKRVRQMYPKLEAARIIAEAARARPEPVEDDGEPF